MVSHVDYGSNGAWLPICAGVSFLRAMFFILGFTIARSLTALRWYPFDVVVGIFDCARFTVDTVLCIDLEFIVLAIFHILIDIGWAVILLWTTIFFEINGYDE